MNSENTLEKSSDESITKSDFELPENDSSLEALVREEQTLARERLREKLHREPTQQETDQWLNEHTEGY